MPEFTAKGAKDAKDLWKPKLIFLPDAVVIWPKGQEPRTCGLLPVTYCVALYFQQQEGAMDKKIIKAAGVWVGLFLCMQSAVAADQARISKAVLGTGTTATYEIINPGAEFAPDTAKIYCAWKAEGVAAGTQVRGVWIAEDVGTVAKPNFKID